MQWSALRALVNSKAASITIAIPFVGIFLLFNGKILEYVEFAHQFLIDTSQDAAKEKNITLNNLYYTYFGLTSFAAGTILFKIFCPFQVRAFPTEEAFFEKQMTFPAHARISASIVYICQHYLRKKNSLLFFMPPNKNQVNTIERVLIRDWARENAVLAAVLTRYKTITAFELGGTWASQYIPSDTSKSIQEATGMKFGFIIFFLEYSIANQRMIIIRYLITLLAIGGLFCASIPGMITFYTIAKRAFTILIG